MKSKKVFKKKNEKTKISNHTIEWNFQQSYYECLHIKRKSYFEIVIQFIQCIVIPRRCQLKISFQFNVKFYSVSRQ